MFYAFLRLRRKKRSAAAATIISVAGKAHQTPFSPKRAESRNAIGMMTINPLSRETALAGRGRSEEVKKIERMMLNPAKGMAVK